MSTSTSCPLIAPNFYFSVLTLSKRVVRRGTLRPSFLRLQRSRIRVKRQKDLSSQSRYRIRSRYVRSKYLVTWLQHRFQRRFVAVPRTACNRQLAVLRWSDFNWGTLPWLDQTPDTVVNPLWGKLQRGFPKLLFKAHIREYINVYLRPRWYRRARLRGLMVWLQRLGEVSPGSQYSLYNEMSFTARFINSTRTRLTTFRFYLRKRWWLPHILQSVLR